MLFLFWSDVKMTWRQKIKNPTSLEFDVMMPLHFFECEEKKGRQIGYRRQTVRRQTESKKWINLWVKQNVGKCLTNVGNNHLMPKAVSQQIYTSGLGTNRCWLVYQKATFPGRSWCAQHTALVTPQWKLKRRWKVTVIVTTIQYRTARRRSSCTLNLWYSMHLLLVDQVKSYS